LGKTVNNRDLGGNEKTKTPPQKGEKKEASPAFSPPPPTQVFMA